MGNKMTTKFHRLANARRAVRYICCPRKNRMCYFTGDCKENEDIKPSLPIDIRKRDFAVYVGSERSRFVNNESIQNERRISAINKWKTGISFSISKTGNALNFV